jgi:dTDP-D-glucose 4,6-dehydratase
VPNAPTHTYRALIEQAAALIGVEPRTRVIPLILLELAGVFSRQTYELIEMRFQADRPYLVNTQKFSRRFWGDATSFEDGLRETIAFYKRDKS